MMTDDLTKLFAAERAVRSPAGSLEQGLSRLFTSLAEQAAPLAVATGALKLGGSAAAKWLAIGFVVGLGGAGAAAQAWTPPEPQAVKAVPVVAPSRPDAPVAKLTPKPEPAAADVASPPPARSERPAASVAAEPVASGVTFDAELRLITAAKAELDRGRPQLAAAWLDDHQRRFPGGVFATDREALHVLVSCSQTRNPALAQAFASRHPGSAMVERLLRACGRLEPVSPKASASDFPK
jgi:hypothetical protein